MTQAVDDAINKIATTRLLTFTELYEPATRFLVNSDAQEYLNALVQRAVSVQKIEDELAVKIQLFNLSLFARRVDTETADRMNTLYGVKAAQAEAA